MSDTLITVIAIFIAVVLMFVFPLMSVSERNDDVSELAVQSATTDFVNKVKTSGVVTRQNYDAFIQTLNATGNTYDVDVELKILDENLSSKVGQASSQKIGENVYYSVYTSQMESELEKSNKYVLKEGDKISVTVKNTNVTIAQMLKNFFYSITGNDSYQIAASKVEMITVNGK